MSQNIFSRYKSGKSIYNACLKSEKCTDVRLTSGSHFIITATNGEKQSCPLHKELKTGTRWKVIKWLLKVGIITGALWLMMLPF